MASSVTMAIAVLCGVLAMSKVGYGQDFRVNTCPIPAQIRNGRYTTTGRSVGSTVTYECFANYELVREAQATCLQDGSWSSLAPECQRIRCPDPTRIPNAGFPVPDPTVGNTVTYRCFPGYTLVGQATLECQPDKTWFPEVPSCIQTTCPQPSIEDGQYTVTSSSLIVGTRITYRCNAGFELVGNVAAICQNSGEWSNQPPTCRATGCPIPESIVNGGVVYLETTVGSSAFYQCNAGFNLIGERERVCQADGSWSPELPTCIATQPPEEGCDESIVETFENLNDGITELITVKQSDGRTVTRITYECNKGYELIGSDSAECDLDSSPPQWTSPMPFCRRNQCFDPPTIANGTRTWTGYNAGDTATYICNAGFVLEGEDLLNCRDTTFDWSPEAPVCIPIQCPPPQLIDNGIILTGRRTYTIGSRVRYECSQGYRLEGEVEATCQVDGRWSVDPPICIRIPKLCDSGPCVRGTCVDLLNDYMCICPAGFTGKNCDTPEQPPRPCDSDPCVRGTCVDLLNDYMCICPAGFTGKNCDTPEPPKPCDSGPCVRGTCVDLLNDYACICPAGFTGKNCDTPEEPPKPCDSGPCARGTCVDLLNDYMCICPAGFTGKNCDTPEEPPKPCDSGPCVRGTCVDLLNDYACICPAGFTGKNCDTPEEPPKPCDSGPCARGTCVDLLNDYMCICPAGFTGKNCDTPEEPPKPCDSGPCVRGTCVDLLNDYACICPAGFTGKNCDTPEEPPKPCDSSPCIRGTCVDLLNDYACICPAGYTGKNCETLINCPPPTPIENGNVRTFTATFQVGSRIRYECNQDHRLEGLPEATCEADGKWSSDPPRCIRLEEPQTPCESDPCLRGICVDLVDDYRCECPTGYTGKNCETLISCGNLEEIENGAVDYSSTTVGSRAVHTCNSGYRMVGDSQAVCQDTGEWSEQPSCTVIAKARNCPLPRGIFNGRVTYTGTTAGSRIRYRCNRGFRLVGRAIATCLANGRWTSAAPTCRSVASCGGGSSSDDNGSRSSSSCSNSNSNSDD